MIEWCFFMRYTLMFKPWTSCFKIFPWSLWNGSVILEMAYNLYFIGHFFNIYYLVEDKMDSAILNVGRTHAASNATDVDRINWCIVTDYKMRQTMRGSQEKISGISSMDIAYKYIYISVYIKNDGPNPINFIISP